MTQEVIKASGEKEKFNEEKIKESLTRSGASEDLAKETVKVIKDRLPENPTSDDVYACAIDHLVDNKAKVALKYSLKRAVSELGPAGYLFEDYMAAVLKEYGYKTETRRIISGKCVDHEMDVVATMNDKRVYVEAKYHNHRGIRSGIKEALYTQARFEDIKSWITENLPKEEQKNYEVWLVTNTKITSQAIQYAKCKQDIKMIAWRYPKKGGLEKMIEDKKLYPVTILSVLSRRAAKTIAKSGIILAKDLLKYPAKELEEKFGINRQLAQKIEKGIYDVCS